MIAFQIDEGILIGFSSILCWFEVRGMRLMIFFEGIEVFFGAIIHPA